MSEKHYLGIAEKVHADMCVEAGIVVLGLDGPSGVRKLNPGDGVVYYSPKIAPDGDILRSFTALGRVIGEGEYERDFDGGHRLWVRDVDWDTRVQPVSIYDLLDQLSWIKKPKNWGFYMRGSHRQIPGEDFALIYSAMRGERS